MPEVADHRRPEVERELGCEGSEVDRPGRPAQGQAAGEPDVLVSKSVNSAVYGDPDLRVWLDERGIRDLVICGIQTNMCVETTARMAGNLGYGVTVALDATRTFDLAGEVAGLGTVSRTAAELMADTALVLQQGGFARIVRTVDLL